MSNLTEKVIKTLNISFSSDSSSNEAAQKNFGERVKTYIAEQRWVKRPLTLSPAICSQFGWKCIKSDLLECVTCSAKLSAHEPKIEVYDAYKACIDKIITDLKESHRKHCPWPLTPCPESFVRMIPLPREEALSQFLQRFKPCLLLESSIPEFKESLPVELNLREEHVISLCKFADPEVNQFRKSMAILAATGWTLTSNESEPRKTLISCTNCQRHTLARLFNSLHSGNVESDQDVRSNVKSERNGCADKSDDKDEEPIEPPTKKKKFSLEIKKGELFNPLYEHRPWCLWILTVPQKCSSDDKANSSSSKMEKEFSLIPGWKIFLKSLLRNVSVVEDLNMKCSPSREKLRNVRNMLETWADPTV